MTNSLQKRNGTIQNDLGNVVDHIFNNALRRFFEDNLWDTEGIANRGMVAVNVREADDHYEVDVIAPGCRKEDFDVQVQSNELQISFANEEGKQQSEEKAGWARNEYVQRSFSRNFTSIETVNPANISATYTDGILRILLPKSEKAKPRTLSIDVK